MTLPPDFTERLFAGGRGRSRLRSLSEWMSERGVPCHIVGGAVRDALLGRATTDFDVVVSPEGLAAAREWASRWRARVATLGEEHQTERVMFGDRLIIDCAAYRATTLELDLLLRDFTVNAIALPLASVVQGNPSSWIDPSGGVLDIATRTLRWTSGRSLDDDPLRMLRAFRLSATHGFRLAPSVLAAVAENRSRIRDSAPERIRDEFFRILGADAATPTLRALDDSRLLDELVPESTVLRGMDGGHGVDAWEHTLEALTCFDDDPIPPILADREREARAYLALNAGQGYRKAAILRYALLLHAVGKPLTRTERAGRVRFPNHYAVGAQTAFDIGKRLTLCNRGCHSSATIIAGLGSLARLSRQPEPSPRVLRAFLHRTEEDWLGVLLVSWAERRAFHGTEATNGELEGASRTMRQVADHYFQRVLPLRERRRLMTGRELMRTFGLSHGRRIGHLLRLVQEAHEDGLVSTREDAIELVRRELGRDPQLPVER
ncbi:CCA tRNA nucleotidyltransferase [Candidatus Poribacteria bacterium]|nr:CCA tRNA nucleotidyltransferase [Candidatus Poribacteria bacterium]